MASKSLFGSSSNFVANKAVEKFGKPDTVNNAGGLAFNLKDKSALAQLVVTGTFNNTYYVSGKAQLDNIKTLAAKCSDIYLAKLAIYAREYGAMKDTPAVLLAILSKRNASLAENIFPRVINNQKMLRNFAQIIRSGQVGSRSFGTVIKRAMKNWLESQTADKLFRGAVGNNPSLADVVKMVHPKAENSEKAAFYSWLLDKTYNHDALPAQVKLFESFKKGETADIPECDFRMLTPFLKSAGDWTNVAVNMPWNALRMNINTFARHGVFADDFAVKTINQKLQDVKSIKNSNAFPYQILTTSKAIRDVAPASIYLALESAMETATENIPALPNSKGIAVCVDVSGSMDNAVTGDRGSVTTQTTCVDVAALVASCILRKNPTKTKVVPFDTEYRACQLNHADGVLINASKLAMKGGGTDCSSALRHLNHVNWHGDLVIMVSDNESWYTSKQETYVWRVNKKSKFTEEWTKLKLRNPSAKLVCIDITPNETTQASDIPAEVLNIGGFSDTVFEIINMFATSDDNRSFAEVIEQEITL